MKNLEDDQNVNRVQVADAADLARRYVTPNPSRTYGLDIHLPY